jgi:hypothetical protein
MPAAAPSAHLSSRRREADAAHRPGVTEWPYPPRVRLVAAGALSGVLPSAAGDFWYADAEFAKARLEIRGEAIDSVRVA